MGDLIAQYYPALGNKLSKLAIADLPTSVSTHLVSLPTGSVEIAVKHDEATSSLYGGNKVRKLEYLLQRARQRRAKRVATFGAAGSNHALATAMHANALGLECTCFLSRQKATASVARTLDVHRQLGTEIVRWGGGVDQVALFRRYLQGRNAWVIPLGGTCWLGALGFVNAGLELARQVDDGLIEKPDRIYIACGTTGSAAGLALGIAATGLDTTVHAVQVADYPFSSETKLRRLMAKTLSLLSRIDPRFTARDWARHVVWRDAFLAGGYAREDAATVAAVALAGDQLDLTLETTYTGKAMAAMLHDLQLDACGGQRFMFWNTYNDRPLPAPDD